MEQLKPIIEQLKPGSTVTDFLHVSWAVSLLTLLGLTAVVWKYKNEILSCFGRKGIVATGRGRNPDEENELAESVGGSHEFRRFLAIVIRILEMTPSATTDAGAEHLRQFQRRHNLEPDAEQSTEEGRA